MLGLRCRGWIEIRWETIWSSLGDEAGFVSGARCTRRDGLYSQIRLEAPVVVCEDYQSRGERYGGLTS